MTNLLIDVGNSCLKMASSGPNGLNSVATVSSKQLLTLEQLLPLVNKKSYDTMVCCSVNGKWDKVLRTLANYLKIPFKQIDHELPLTVKIAGGTTSQIGADLKLYAYTALQQGHNNAVIMSLGTATTVSILKEGVFTDGVIGLGLYSALQGLTTAIPALKGHTKLQLCPQVAGKDTTQAINFGLVNMTGYALQGLLTTLMSPSYQPTLFLTGGDASLLYPVLSQQFTIQHRPLFLFEGLNHLFNSQL